MQKIGTIGDGKSAVATPDGKIRKKKKASQVIIYFLSAFFQACSNQTEPYFIPTVTDSGNE